MGSDKAALMHPDGRPLARRTLDLLSVECARVFVSLRHDQDAPPMIVESPQIVIVRDPEGASEGPLGGILCAMRSAPAASCQAREPNQATALAPDEACRLCRAKAASWRTSGQERVPTCSARRPCDIKHLF